MDFSLGKFLSVAVESHRASPAFFHDIAFEKDCSTYKCTRIEKNLAKNKLLLSLNLFVTGNKHTKICWSNLVAHYMRLEWNMYKAKISYQWH